MVNSDPLDNELLLEEMYCEEEESIFNIAKELNLDCSDVRSKLNSLGFDVGEYKDVEESESGRQSNGTDPYEPQHDIRGRYPWRDKELMEFLYIEEGLGAQSIAKEMDCGENTIYRWLNKHNIPTRSATQDKPIQLDLSSNGYEKWRHRCGGDRHSITVHRLLAVAEFGFDEVVDKEIHHINHNSWDNRHDNIIPLTTEDYLKLHNNPNLSLDDVL